jgi:LmbE family N-acetylglucosaminyl deacetylase
MSGTLAHARRFRVAPYTGADGRTHHELARDDGDSESLSNIRWDEMKRLAAALGIPEDAWPEYPSPLDIDPADLAARNEWLRPLLASLPESAVAGSCLLHRLWRWARGGILFFFSEW